MAWERTGFTLLLVLIQSILIGLKLDRVIGSSWWAVFVPAYVWVGIMLLVVCVAWYHLSSREREKEKRGWLSSPRTIYFALTALLVVTLVILVAVRAQGDSSLPWSVVFIPIYVYLGLLLIVVLYQGIEHARGNLDRSTMDVVPGITNWLWWFWLLNLLVWGCLWIIFLAVKLDGGLKPWTYWAILSPLWVLLILAALLCISAIPFIVVRQLEIDFWRVCFYFLVYVAAVLALIFITLRADTSIHWKWSLVFIPLYIGEALLFLYATTEWLYEPLIEYDSSEYALEPLDD